MKKKLVITILSLTMVMASALPTFAAEKNTTCNKNYNALFNTVLNYMGSCSGNVNMQWGTQDNISSNSSLTSQVVALVNKERSAAGLGSLTSDSALNRIAQLKAEDMAKNKYFSHNSPTYGSAFDMMNQYGIKYSTAGENIAKGQKTAASVMKGWMNSSGHRANILNSSYNKIGVGYAKDASGNTYWVQMFIKQ
ncbi:MAG TPA: CAP domain-containing protein [Anaerovoracaceae bacterium]|nr:CAP domain-containing protein [Anaerovoracaceae bacterium]